MATDGKAEWSDFAALDIRTGTIIDASPFPEARNPSFILQIDFGELGIKKSSAQITERYSITDLIGKRVIAVINFPPKQIANHLSECLVLGSLDKEGVNLLTSDLSGANGTKIG